MRSTSSHDQPAIPAFSSETEDVGPALLPSPYESATEYLTRLQAHHARVGSLIVAIEERRPDTGPGGRRERKVAERRYLDDERRTGTPQRREGVADTRSTFRERRSGPRERRFWRVPRREGLERRRNPLPVPWRGRLRADRVTIIWAVQIAVWVTIAVLALVFGLG